MAYKIQQLGLGGILDQAIAITRNHFGLLFTIMLLLLIPFGLISGLVAIGMTPELPPEPTMEDFAAFNEQNMRLMPWMGIFGLVNGLLVLPLTNAAVIWAVAQLYLGQPITAAGAFRHGLRRLGPLIWTSILMYLAIFGGLLLLIIPGILFALWFGLAQHVVVIEGISGTKALGRSKRLVRNHLGTFLAMGFILFIIFFALAAGTELIGQPHVKLLAATLLNAVATMVGTAAGVVFYFSCRCAEENFDLHYLAESIGREAAADEQVAPATL